MKKFLVAFAVLLFVMTVSAEQKNLFAKASVKKIDGVTAMVSGLDIQVKADADSLKKFVKNDFYKAFGFGKNVEPELFRAVRIGDASIYKFVPYYKGIKVDGIYTVVTMKDGKIARINNGLSDIDIDITKMIPENQAVKSAMAARNIKVMPKNYFAEKLIVRYFGRFVPAYKISFPAVTLADTRYQIVNALTGEVIQSSHSTFFAEGDEADTGDIAPDPADSGDTEEPVAKRECDGSETNIAKIWQFNPLVTPELTEVELPWVASFDDSELTPELIGTLITEKDENGRKIKAYNCPDDDTMITIDPASLGYDLSAMGITELQVHTCHPMPLANKCENGSFIYDDCDSGHKFSTDNMSIDKIDRCAEISMYYHASKIYEYIRSLYTDIREGEFYLQTNQDGKSLNVISNFVMPDFNDIASIFQGKGNKLAPFDNAFFTQEQPMLNVLLKDFGVDGDLLVFGQGTKADLGYDGDVVYHEFGHATLYTTGITGLEFADKYGITVEPGALHEGMADTFAFIMTDNTCTGEYASKGFADAGAASQMDKEVVDGEEIYCMRSALNNNKVFENFVGEVHFDGQPLLASNWDIYQLVKGNDKDTQKHRDNLAKLILKALYSIGSKDVSYKLWAETLMAEVENDENFKDKADGIRKILEERNFFEEIRARSVNEKITDTMYIPAGGDSGMMGGGGISVEDGDKTVKIGPAYIQYYFDVPADADKTALKLKAKISSDGSDMAGGFFGGGESQKPELEIYYRKAAPIEYVDGENAIKAEKDGKSAGEKEWFVRNVEKGKRYYFQFVNLAGVSATASGISVELADAPADDGNSDADGDDKEGGAADDEMSYSDDAKKRDDKDSGGCSMVL